MIRTGKLGNPDHSLLIMPCLALELEELMKKIFKFIVIAILFVLSLTLFNQVVTFFGKGTKCQMAKLV